MKLKQCAFSCILFLVGCFSLFAEAAAVYFRVKDGLIDGYYWYVDDPTERTPPRGVLESGTIVRGNYVMSGRVSVSYNSKIIIMAASSLESIHKEDEFPAALLRNYDDKNQMIWFPLYYIEAISKKDKNIVYKSEKDYLESEAEAPWTGMLDWFSYEETLALWDVYYDRKYGIEFFQNGLHIDREYLLIDTIRKVGTSYYVTVLGSVMYGTVYTELSYLPWPLNGKTKFFTLIFEFDGDYVDVYLENRETPFAKFALVSPDFIDFILDLVWTGTLYGISEGRKFDPSKITSWPRRSDGSMDYPPPQDISGYTATHRTLDRLRLRDTANTSSKIVTTLPQDTAVQLLETGQETTIDGITAPWVRVLSSTGYEGWCFSGYLEPIAAPPSPSPEPPAIEPYTADPPPLVESTAHTFPWIWIAAGGAVMLTAGAVIVIIVKKKKH